MPQRSLKSARVVHKSTGGTLPAIPQPVHPVRNPPPLISNTVAHPPVTAIAEKSNRRAASPACQWHLPGEEGINQRSRQQAFAGDVIDLKADAVGVLEQDRVVAWRP